MNVFVQLFGVLFVISGSGLFFGLLAGAPASALGFGLPIFIIGLVGWFVAGALDK